MARQGIQAQGDVLVNELADGTDINELWTDAIAALGLYNGERTTIASLLSFKTTNASDVVPQSIGTSSFERATEHGLPKSAGTPADALLLGYTFDDYDLRTAFSWKFLRSADRRAVDAVINGVMESDNKLVTGTILRRLFDPTEGATEFGARVFGLYTGNDGVTPPPYLGNQFPSNTNHYLPTQNATIDSQDIEDAMNLIRVKGYGLDSLSQLLILANPVESELIQTWRSGKESRSGGPLARHSFIPSVKAPPYLQPENIVGQPISGEYYGREVLGSYGPAWLLETSFVPAGYVAVIASGGPNSERNVVGMRELPNTAYQGLRTIPGNFPGYPLIDAFYQRSFGVGVRQRGAAVCLQVTAGSTYTAPTALIPV
ncbi:hypothetical protein [Mycobacteroides abscessus]|uniref:hypothetical protein n=1 Tax=Mycobacteroides abscessus TaxID=36809 RepID=UPI00034CB5E0|nr:hypothetical protein [Mycobacteroides abscessus]MBE5448386.1 hypothetical protein [Mycobacteroides abscessus]MDO3211123.1 hypothetical protein [Mycobacteroides abscessus subsp. abscessus]SHP30551.1 Putative bacteriophage protein [Mycobacteroides abscessus subsp. abscessus]SHT04983.1 Putative bacteriophage protein [Mycobacteroides abscessus subsp. abscessus]SHU35393.1 Putative bacteriophage protein [Mycobacteroides abscessus subsp. abscessus]